MDFRSKPSWIRTQGRGGRWDVTGEEIGKDVVKSTRSLIAY